MSSRRPLLFVPAVCVLALWSSIASGQSYGLGDQLLTIGPTDFRPTFSGATYSISLADGYLYGQGYGFAAPLRLPDGAEITGMCFYFFDANGSGSSASIQAAKLPAGGQQAGLLTIPDSVASENLNIGYGTVCTGPMSYTFHDDADLDGLGTAHVAHQVSGQTSTGTAIGGVRIAWHRQASPPPSTPTFNDVPASDPAFQFVEALAASGITAGCAGGNYCPDAPLTRRQMAVFLGKALGLHWAN